MGVECVCVWVGVLMFVFVVSFFFHGALLSTTYASEKYTAPQEAIQVIA